MSDFERQLREHYQHQQLSAERADAILKAGRTAALRARRRRWMLALAAVVVLGFGVFGLTKRGVTRNSTGVLPETVAEVVKSFFSQPDYELSRVSSVPEELAEWLRSQGAPASFELPQKFASLPSFGCRVFDVEGERVYLICFFLDGAADDSTAAGMMKKQMVVTAPDGTMMKKDRPLVHLVFAPRAAFRDPPAPGARVQLPSNGDWKSYAWSEGELVYLVVSTISSSDLEQFAAAN
jgi:hypothetical protein